LIKFVKYRFIYFKNYFELKRATKVIIGAGGKSYDGWVSTDIQNLNITKRSDFEKYWNSDTIEAFLAEHVWEHLTEEEGKVAFNNCYDFLKTGGYLRLAVPDGYNPNPDYIKHVKPRGTGAAAEDHKILYNYHLLSDLLSQVGFKVDMLEYWDEKGQFHFNDWDILDGFIKRSKDHDERNSEGSLNYSSLIVDAVKPS